jgi:tetratricopeptide (TPR) repeat protein
VDKDRFLFIVKNYTALSEQDGVYLAVLEEQYPYSQLIKNLAARAAQDNRLNSFQYLLKKSAVYCFDRTVLKQLLLAPRTEAPWNENFKHSEITVLETAANHNTLETANDLIETLYLDMAKLKELKHHFEEVIEKYDTALAQRGEVSRRIVAEPVKHSIGDEDGLIEQIKSSKTEVEIKNVASVEQNQIIEQFINSSPSIKKGKESSDGDLAEKSAAFGDHIISETLVEILLKQGKKEKAIEVLRKLIWKFPQKKTIFAALIDDLKK